jgi:hypothetical protein
MGSSPVLPLRPEDQAVSASASIESPKPTPEQNGRQRLERRRTASGELRIGRSFWSESSDFVAARCRTLASPGSAGSDRLRVTSSVLLELNSFAAANGARSGIISLLLKSFIILDYVRKFN